MEKIGNVRSDGRPIIGLDARDLLEIVLETSETAFLIPAHIWTPWFSIFGSKSGFDALEECFEDLTPHIFALETGLSSDPEMNWRVSNLKGLNLVSNSDAHSLEKIAREANLFDTELSFSGIRSALMDKKGSLFKGTFEFFPEEGKYHLDGHRKCGIRLKPEETRKHQGLCPKCGKPLTLGVLHRISELADQGEGKRPDDAIPFYRLLPLSEILSEVLEVGPASKKVTAAQDKMIKTYGPELTILHEVPLNSLEGVDMPLFKEALRRVRNNEIFIRPGYDGEFGTIRIFTDHERRKLLGQRSLFALSEPEKSTPNKEEYKAKKISEPLNLFFKEKGRIKENKLTPKKPEGLNDDQRQAVQCPVGPVLVIAGPGTGKTHTLTQRIFHRIQTDGVPAANILAITFTHKAALEMKERLLRSLNGAAPPLVATFHAFCLDVLKETASGKSKPVTVIDEIDRRLLVSDAIRMSMAIEKIGRINADAVLNRIVSAKQQLTLPKDRICDPEANGKPLTVMTIYRTYEELLKVQRLLDYEDLISKVVSLFENDEKTLHFYQQRYAHLFIDEYQDINYAQYRLIRMLYPKTDFSRDLFAIGDPNQAIYGFRGSDVRFFNRFVLDYPGAKQIRLVANYRCTQTVLDASKQIIYKSSTTPRRDQGFTKAGKTTKIELSEYPNEKQEAEGIARSIEAMVGGTGFFFVDSGKTVKTGEEALRGFSDVAVLFRIKQQGVRIAEALDNVGIPYQFVRKKAFFTKPVVGICSLLKLAYKQATFGDLNRAFSFAGVRIGKKDLLRFKTWCLKNGFSVQQALDRLQQGSLNDNPLTPREPFLSGYRKIQEIRQNISGLTVSQQITFLFDAYGHTWKRESGKNIDESYGKLLGLAQEHVTDVDRFLDAVALSGDTDIFNERAQRVSLLTLHAAKGLEFPIVFIAGCEDDLIPHERSKTEAGDMEEERRLFYVGVTRAKEGLFLTWAQKRTLFGQARKRQLSPFILDIHKNLIQYEVQKKKIKSKRGHIQMPLFQ